MTSKRWALALVVVIGAAACADEVETPEKAARKAECRQLEKHAIQISPQYQAQIAGLSEADQAKRLDQLIARVPVEDIEQCAAADRATITCMLAAADVAAVRTCIPTKN